ncbi:MAG: hypothetical protein NTV39_00370 [Candidatus Saccharibacteria bacterium]|nr:hypothetical protein [Candidatus Saccharibacteria bacterium]
MLKTKTKKILTSLVGIYAPAVRNKETFKVYRNPITYEVTTTSDVTLEDYRRSTPVADWELLERWAKTMAGKSVVFINPTMEGGGVAMLRPPLVYLLNMLGVEAHWYVMNGKKNPDDPNPFIFTKQMHNILQRRAAREERINEIGKSIHQKWNQENADVLAAQPIIRTADVIVIDDPQPAPLKKYIDKVNPNVKWVWRSHIDTSGKLMSDPSTPQGEVAAYIMNECGIREVDAVVAHPVKEFIYPGMYDKTFFAPATVEPLDDLNQTLSRKEIKAGILFINHEISIKNKEFASEGRLADIQSEINVKRRRIVLIARFDESKGMDKAMALGAKTRQKMRDLGIPEAQLPQIIIVGNGSVDDPSGVPMYEKMLQIRREEYPNDKKDIIIMLLRHNYKAINALMHQTVSRNSRRPNQMIALQTSEAEGCETRISDWIRHGVPVVVSNRGGMSLQVVEGKSGLVLNYDKPDFDIERGALFITQLMVDDKKYAAMTKSAMELAESFNNREFTTTANATRLLRVFHIAINGKKADKIWKIGEMVENKQLQSSSSR